LCGLWEIKSPASGSFRNSAPRECKPKKASERKFECGYRLIAWPFGVAVDVG
jgi:hypothetical protein